MLDEIQILGYVVTAVITLGSFIVVIQRFTEPIHELKIVIQELRDCISTLKTTNAMQDKLLEKHSEQIDKIDKRVRDIENKMFFYHEKE